MSHVVGMLLVSFTATTRGRPVPKSMLPLPLQLSCERSWFAPPFLIRRARRLIPLACTFAQARSSAPSPATNGLYRPKIVGESANFLYLISTFEEKEKERKKPTKLASSRYFISFVVDCVPQKRPTAPGLRAWSPTALLSRPGRA